MKVYLDICCLKRLWDDQSQARIAVEAAAAEMIMNMASTGRVTVVRSLAHDVENALNSDPERARKVRAWLEQFPVETTIPEAVTRRFEELATTGIQAMDAFHCAWAEHLGADMLITTDDRFMKSIARVGSSVRAINPTEFVREIAP